ncbi:Aspartyl protease family protein [Citrus sinensis]|nr:Aspartyl protease family protein [Citrus sinensis]
MWILSKAFLLFICLLCSSNNGAYADDNDLSHSHIVSVSSLLPPNVCNRTRTALPQGPDKASLEVVSKYGPCSRLNQGISTHAPSLSEILRQDQQRLHLKNSRRLRKPFPEFLKRTEAFTFPANINDTVADEYYIVVAIGEPKQYVSLLLDTGNCNSKECPFNIQYADGSGSGGFWATDRITIQEANSNGYFTRYPFLLGCINNSSGDKSGASGIMGLDRSPVSIITRTNTSYFSYCLPSPYGSTGYITFGKTDTVNSKFIKYTPIVTTSEQSEFYDIILTGISVGGKKLPFNTSYFTKFGAIIDSGNIITRLPPPIYAALRSAFHKRMKKYKKAKGLEDLLDTCYDLSAYETVVVPKIAIHFLGGVDLELDVRGTLVVASVSQVCLGFATYPPDPNSITLGNVQQRGHEVHYDVAGRRLGFGPGNCS